MSALSRMKNDPTQTPQRGVGVVFGKLPLRADFLPHPAYESVLEELDTVIRGSIANVNGSEYRLPWQKVHTPLIILRHPERFFVGEILGSVDASNREYPLVAGVLVINGQQDYALSPIVFEVALTAIGELMLDARHNSDEAYGLTRYLAKYTESLVLADDVSLADSLIEQRLRSKVSVLLLDWLGSNVDLHTFLLNLLFWSDFQIRYRMSELSECISLPIPLNEDRLMACSMWLQVLQSCLPSRENALLAFVKTDDSSESFNVFIGAPRIDTLSGLFESTLSSFDLSKPSAVWSQHQAYAEISFALDRLLASEGLPMKTLVTFLSKARDVIAGRRAEVSNA